MPTYKGIRCSVIVESRKLDEYEDKKSGDANKPDVITRYIDIDGTKGRNFILKVEALPDFNWDPSFTHVGCQCLLDNQPLYTPTISQSYPMIKIEGSKYVQDVNGEEFEFTKQMFFSQFNIVTEGSGFGTNIISDPTDPRLQSIGRIEVLLKRSILVGAASAPRACAYNSSVISINQAIKGKSPIHSVQLGPAKPIPKSPWGQYNYLDTDAQPFMLFVFLYRTHTYLDNMGIIPHVPFHSELPIVIPDEDDSLKTREELLAEVQALRSQLNGRGDSSGSRKLKRERNDERVKAEKNSKKFKGSVTKSTQDKNEAEIVDLTGDE